MKEIKLANGSTIAVGGDIPEGQRVRGLPAKDVLASLRAVLDYNWDGEEEDYEDRPPDEKSGHVFEHLKRIDTWLAGEVLPGVDVVILTEGGLIQQVYTRARDLSVVVVDHDKDHEFPYAASEPDVAPIDGDGGIESAQCGGGILAAVRRMIEENNGVPPKEDDDA